MGTIKRSFKMIAICLAGGSMLLSCNRSQDNISVGDTQDPQTVKMAVPTPNGQFMPNELLIRFRENIDQESRMNVFGRFNATVLEHINTNAMQRAGDHNGVYLVHMPLEVLQAVGQLKNMPEIEYAEPNYIYNHTATSDDTYYTNGSLWGMYGSNTSPSNQYGCGAGTAWASNKTGSSSVYVAIIDEGSMYYHEDLSNNMWVNPYETADGKDNDGNGYVDDIRGWDFDGNNNTTFDGNSDDHGTHVSGTIGAVGGNGKGVAGVNWDVQIITCKFLGRRGGTTANAVKAVDYVTDLKTRHGLNIVATNNSWGGGGFSQSLKNAIDRAGNNNILFVAAAGNNGSNNDVTPSYPASYTSTNIIAVAAITLNGSLSSFSQYGATSVDIGAPGSGIYSTLPGRKNSSTYGSYSGTSMATPHVAGACALYASLHPGSTAAQIKAAILSNAVSTSSLSGKCVSGGRLDVSGF